LTPFALLRTGKWVIRGAAIVAVLIAVGGFALWFSVRPYSAEASGEDRFLMPVEYLTALSTFAVPGAEERFVVLSGAGEVGDSSWQKVGVNLKPGPSDGGNGGGGNGGAGMFGQLLGAVTGSHVNMRGTITVRPFDDRMQGRELTFVKTVQARLGELRMGTTLAEPIDLLRRYEMTIVMRRVDEGVETSVDVTMGIEYDVPSVPFVEQMVQDGVEEAVQLDLKRTREAIEKMLDAKAKPLGQQG